MNFIRTNYDRLPASVRTKIRSFIPDSLLRRHAFQKTDVFLISYPKCGRTWLRLMIGKAIQLHYNLPETEEILFLNWKQRPSPEVPLIRVVHDNRPMLRRTSELEESKAHYRSKQVIFLVRDPRDVIVSSYFEMKNRSRIFGENPYEERSAEFDGSLSEFIHRDQGGFDTILRYFNIWAENRNQPKKFLLVRYEDMISDPTAELSRVITFLDLPGVPERTLTKAVEFASFENMRKMETEGTFQGGILKPADQADTDSYKTRKGRIGGYLEYLEQEEIDYLNMRIGEDLSPIFGYVSKVSISN